LAAIPANALSSQQSLYASTAVFVFGSCVANFVLAAMLGPGELPLLVATFFSALIAQLAVQSLWIVWSTRPLWLRHLAGVLVGWLLVAAFLVGLGAGVGPNNLDEVARVFLCCVPLVMLSVQAPLWGLRTYARWQIASAHRPAMLDRPLSIGDMIAATLAVALALGLLRLASDDPEFYQVAWIGWLIAVPSIAVISLASLPPLLYLVLRRDSWPVVGFLAWCGYATVVLVAAAIVILVLSGGPDAEGVLLLFVTPFGASTATWLALLVLRAGGYRLTFASERQRPDV
jgi:hypothetical protein